MKLRPVRGPSRMPGASGATTRTPTSPPPLFAVADGMGGAQAGEVASALAAARSRSRARAAAARRASSR